MVTHGQLWTPAAIVSQPLPSPQTLFPKTYNIPNPTDWPIPRTLTAATRGGGGGRAKGLPPQGASTPTLACRISVSRLSVWRLLLLLLLLYSASSFYWHGPSDRPVGSFLHYQSVGTATGPTALCGVRTTPRSEVWRLLLLVVYSASTSHCHGPFPGSARRKSLEEPVVAYMWLPGRVFPWWWAGWARRGRPHGS